MACAAEGQSESENDDDEEECEDEVPIVCLSCFSSCSSSVSKNWRKFWSTSFFLPSSLCFAVVASFGCCWCCWCVCGACDGRAGFVMDSFKSSSNRSSKANNCNFWCCGCCREVDASALFLITGAALVDTIGSRMMNDMLANWLMWWRIMVVLFPCPVGCIVFSFHSEISATCLQAGCMVCWIQQDQSTADLSLKNKSIFPIIPLYGQVWMISRMQQSPACMSLENHTTVPFCPSSWGTFT